MVNNEDLRSYQYLERLTTLMNLLASGSIGFSGRLRSLVEK